MSAIYTLADAPLAVYTLSMSNTIYNVGDVVTLTLTVKLGGVLTDATTMTLSYKDPSLATTSLATTSSTTGTYTQNVTATFAGNYEYRWVGLGTAAGAAQSFFVVQPANV